MLATLTTAHADPPKLTVGPLFVETYSSPLTVTSLPPEAIPVSGETDVTVRCALAKLAAKKTIPNMIFFTSPSSFIKLEEFQISVKPQPVTNPLREVSNRKRCPEFPRLTEIKSKPRFNYLLITDTFSRWMNRGGNGEI